MREETQDTKLMGYVRLLNKGISLYLNLSQDERKFIYSDRNIIS